MLAVVIRVIRVKLSKFLPVVGKLIVIAMAGHKDYFDDPCIAVLFHEPEIHPAV
jgi:hypothetical protein